MPSETKFSLALNIAQMKKNEYSGKKESPTCNIEDGISEEPKKNTTTEQRKRPVNKMDTKDRYASPNTVILQLPTKQQ